MHLGGPEQLAGLLAELRSLPARVLDTVGPLPLSALGGVAAEPVDPMPSQETAGLLTDLDDTDLDRLIDVVGAGTETPLAVVQLRHLGGALARGTEAQGPHGAIEEQYQLFCLGVPVVPELVPAIEAAFAAVRAALAGRLSGRTTFNFLGANDDPAQAFPDGVLDRLRAVKAAVDPDGVVRSNRPVAARG